MASCLIPNSGFTPSLTPRSRRLGNVESDESEEEQEVETVEERPFDRQLAETELGEDDGNNKRGHLDENDRSADFIDVDEDVSTFPTLKEGTQRGGGYHLHLPLLKSLTPIGKPTPPSQSQSPTMVQPIPPTDQEIAEEAIARATELIQSLPYAHHFTPLTSREREA